MFYTRSESLQISRIERLVSRIERALLMQTCFNPWDSDPPVDKPPGGSRYQGGWSEPLLGQAA